MEIRCERGHWGGSGLRSDALHFGAEGAELGGEVGVSAVDVVRVEDDGFAFGGETVVLDPYHVDRGYTDLAAKLRTLGAKVERIRPEA